MKTKLSTREKEIEGIETTKKIVHQFNGSIHFLVYSSGAKVENMRINRKPSAKNGPPDLVSEQQWLGSSTRGNEKDLTEAH